MDPIQYLRGLARGLTADVVGTPADIATQATNLGIAGGGYLAHKLGLVQTPPDLLDPANVPLTSDWFVKNTPLQGEGTEYNLGRMTPAIVSMGRAALNPDLVSPTSAALRSPSPEAQRGALYIDKNGQLGAEDLALYHNTKMGTGGKIERLRVPQELRNLSQAITAKDVRPVQSFGSNYLVPNPKKFEPRRSNTVIKPSDFYTPRAVAAKEKDYETVLAALNTDPQIKDVYNGTFEMMVQQGYDKKAAADTAMKAAETMSMRLRAQARLADRSLGNILPAHGTFSEGGKFGPSDTTLSVKQESPLSYQEVAAAAPTFRSFEQFDKSPYGGTRLRAYPKQLDTPAGLTDLAQGFAYKLQDAGYDLGPDPRFGTLQDVEYVTKHLRRNGELLDPDEVAGIVGNMRQLVNNIRKGPSEYAEAKTYGPTLLVGDNFPAFIHTQVQKADPYFVDQLQQKGIKFYHMPVRFKDNPRAITDLIREIQTNTLRGQPLP